MIFGVLFPFKEIYLQHETHRALNLLVQELHLKDRESHFRYASYK